MLPNENETFIFRIFWSYHARGYLPKILGVATERSAFDVFFCLFANSRVDLLNSPIRGFVGGVQLSPAICFDCTIQLTCDRNVVGSIGDLQLRDESNEMPTIYVWYRYSQCCATLFTIPK